MRDGSPLINPVAPPRAGDGIIPYVCPRCHATLVMREGTVDCTGCGAGYPRLDYAYADFAGAEITFDDWWVQSPTKRERWLAEEAPREEEYEVGLARRFVMPLLEQVGYRPGRQSLLSAGCGLAADVDALNDAGYLTFGIDCGNRVLRWPARRHQARLARADMKQLPFPDAAFDLVISFNTLEHVGVVGDTTTVAPDHEEQRLAALQSLLRVTKPGGHLLLTGLSRTIPLDFGHLQHSRFVRLHSPWERFLLSYGDVKRLCRSTDDVEWTKPLPLRGFFAWTNLRHYPLVRPLLPAVDWLLGSLPPAAYGSWLSPIWIVLARRRLTTVARRPRAIQSTRHSEPRRDPPPEPSVVAGRGKPSGARARVGARGVRAILTVRTCDCGIQGPESLILSLAETYRSRGVRYVIANLWDGDPPTVALREEAFRRGLESHVIATTWGLNPVVVPRLVALIRQVRPEVVHTHDVKAEFAALVATRLTDTPLIGSFYGRLAMHSRVLKWADQIRFPAFRLFDRVLANSEAQRAELLRWRLPADRVAVVPSFVDSLALGPPTAAEVAAARQRLGIAATRPVLTTVARLSLNKGHHDMLQALVTIRAALPDVLYLVSGEGESAWRGEGGQRGDLERTARELGLADHVRFLGYYPDLRTVLHASDVLVSASLREGMQVSLLEAMATGLPIVATAVGGTPDAVADGETGLLVPPAQPPAMAAAVLEVLGNRERAQGMGAAGRRRVEERFDTRVVAEQVLRLCEDVVAGRMSAAADLGGNGRRRR